MINLLPPDQDKTFWNPNTTFLDIYCKSGVFLEILYRRLMGVLANFPGYEDEQVRSSHILNNQLFGLSPLDDGGLMLATRRVYGDIFHKNLIHYDIQNVMKDISSRAGKNFELYEQNLVNTLKQVTNKEFNKMNFNVVIGNPPYNRGGDIDFVNLGYELCNKYTVMITPAKWQTAEANQRIDSQMSYGDFRKKIVPHMKEVVYYPDCYDLFDIKEASGICYYILYKDKSFDKCLVVNKQELQKSIESFEIRAILNRETLWNVGNSVVDLMGRYNKLDIEYIAQLNTKARYFVNSNNQSTKGGGGYSTKMQNASGKWVTKDGIVGHGGMLFNPKTRDIPVITKINVIDSLDAAKDLLIAGASSNLFYSDSLEECESYVSYITTKLIRFLILINFNKQTLFDRNTFRLVPSPMILDNSGNRIRGEFDHIYTDDELYKTWNIPQKYIEVIEAVVKERDPEIYEMAYNERAFKIFKRAKEVELNIHVKMQEILRKNGINIQEYGYDLQMLKNSEDIEKCKDLVDSQISLVDQFFQLSSLESSVSDLVNCFCRYPKMVQTWMKNKEIYKNGKFISIDSILHEILVGYVDFLDRNKWELIKNKLKTYGIYSKQQIEMIVFLYNLVEILTSLQFNQDNLKVLQEQGVSSGDNQLGESKYSVVYKLSQRQT